MDTSRIGERCSSSKSAKCQKSRSCIEKIRKASFNGWIYSMISRVSSFAQMACSSRVFLKPVTREQKKIETVLFFCS